MSRVFKALDRIEQERMLKESTPLLPPTSRENGHDTSIASPLQPPLPMSRQPQRLPLNPEDIEPHLVTLFTPESLEAEHYRNLGHQIDQMNKNAGLHILAVSSPTMGDGKTTTILNLAGVLAQIPDKHVLLVDMDLRRPMVASYLGLSRVIRTGLVDAILDPTLSLVDIVTVCEPFNLSVVSAGRVTTSSYELLQSPRVGELLAEGRQSYDCIIIDTPPLLPLADCRFIEKWIDGLLIIISAHKTPRKLLDEALAIAEPSKLIGLLFNRDKSIVRGTYSYYYSYYTVSAKGGGRPRSSTRHRRATT